MRSLTQAAINSQRIKEDIMYHPDITTAIARQHRAELMTEARNTRMAREARTARHTAGTTPQAGRRGWARMIPAPGR